MADRSGSTRFQALLESALQAYESKTGVILSQHPLAVQIQRCHSVDDITSLLQGRARAFNDLRERDRMMKAIKTTVLILTPLSATSSLTDYVGLVCQNAPMACLMSLIVFHRQHSHLRQQYRLLSVSYSMYATISTSHVDVFSDIQLN
jgi:hypothetical protein